MNISWRDKPSNFPYIFKGIYIDQVLLDAVNSSSKQSGNSSSNVFANIGGKSLEGLVFKVQVGAFRNKVSESYFEGIPELQTNEANDGITRYTSGEFATLNEAKSRKSEIKDNIDGAFITAYHNGDRVTIVEAVKLLK